MATPATDGGDNTRNDNITPSIYAPYIPHDLKYSAEFEDSLVSVVLNTTAQQDGIRVIPEDSREQSSHGRSIRATSVTDESLPSITEEELPLPLSDPRRIFASPVAGIKLTHPGGYLEGGPGLEPDLDTFPDDFISKNSSISNGKMLRKALDREVEASIELLRERLRARRRAKEKNEQIEKELRTLKDQHSMELKLQRRMAEEQKAKKEAKARRHRERGAD